MLIESSEFDDSSDENYIMSNNEGNIDIDVFTENEGTRFVGSSQERNKGKENSK